MAIQTAMCTSYKKELFEAKHDHSVGGNVFNMALYTSAANLDASIAAYTALNEVAGTGYTAKGVALTNIAPSFSGTTAFTQFQNATWDPSTITARGCMIFNVTGGDISVSVHDFGADFSSINGPFTVVMPTNDANTALLRIV